MSEKAPNPTPGIAWAELGDDDTARWEAVALRYRAPLRGFFANRVRVPADADDLVQEVFVQLIRRAQGGPIERVEQYLFQVAANVLRDQARRRQVRHHDAHESFDEALHDSISEISPERELLGRESLDRLRVALHELPERTRDIFVLRVLEHYRTADVARLTGISTRAVEKHMTRALAHLASVLD